MGDGHRLERVIDNVIDNAISFSPPGGLVCVRATRLGNDVHIGVDDDGPGVSPEDRVRRPVRGPARPAPRP